MGLGSVLTLLNTSQDLAWADEASTVPAYPACTTTADDAALQAARGAFEAGKAAFNEADYARAIIYWEDAFRRDCSATLLLKNLGRAYEANTQYTHAVVAFTTFLEREPNAEDRAELEAQIEHLKNRSAVPATPQPAAPTAPAPQAKRAPPAAPAPTPTTEEEYGYPARSASTNEAPSVVGPIVLASVGAAAAVTGGVLWWGARQDEVEAEKACPSRMGCPVEVENLGNDAIDRQLRWGLLAGGGLILLGGGVAWYLLQPSETTALVPQVGPHFAGLHLNGRF